MQAEFFFSFFSVFKVLLLNISKTYRDSDCWETNLRVSPFKGDQHHAYHPNGSRTARVTNLVASHHTTAAHHPWTTFPIMHCTHTFPSTITPITQLSPITNQTWLSHHTCTSFTHPHISSTLPYTRCKVLFCTGWHSESFPCILFPWTAYILWPFAACLLTLPAFRYPLCLPRPLHCPCCWFCLAYVTPVIASDPCLFDLALLFIKAAFGSPRAGSAQSPLQRPLRARSAQSPLQRPLQRPLRARSAQSPLQRPLRARSARSSLSSRSRPALLRLRWFRPALLRLRWSRPALLRLRWSRPARLLRGFCLV